MKAPNGERVAVKGVGEVILQEGLMLKNVLEIPDFYINLISISKLTKDLGCSHTFLLKLCVIQDLQTRTLIGLGKECDGLYQFVPTK